MNKAKWAAALTGFGVLASGWPAATRAQTGAPPRLPPPPVIQGGAAENVPAVDRPRPADRKKTTQKVDRDWPDHLTLPDPPVHHARSFGPSEPPPLLPPIPPMFEPDRDQARPIAGPVTRLGAAFLVGGGYEDFTDGNLRSMSSGGGTWNARAVVGTRRYIGLEGAYVGATRAMTTLGLGREANLVSNGVEGVVRLNAPISFTRGRSLLEPFGFLGLGWQHYAITNTNVNTSDVASRDDVMTLPAGAGLEYSYGRFLADARFTYRQTYYNDLMPTTGGRLNNWGVGTQLGMQF